MREEIKKLINECYNSISKEDNYDPHGGMFSSNYDHDVDLSVVKHELSILNDKITALIERESGWISVDNAISGNTYIVWFINEYGKRRVCNAIYYDKYECEASDDTYQDDDWFDVKNGIYYIPKGWYEASEYHECQMQIICDILGIIPLPNPPKSKEV